MYEIKVKIHEEADPALQIPLFKSYKNIPKSKSF